MIDDFLDKCYSKFTVIHDSFNEWSVLNDTIMGGSSYAICNSISKGLSFEGNLIEKGGGFVSCRSSLFSPPKNYSKYKGFLIEIEGEGRTLKFGVSCENATFGVSNLISGNLRWVFQFPTEMTGSTTIKIPFKSLIPSVRAKPVSLPVNFRSSAITQFQLLYSKFGEPGLMNPCFTPGPFQICLHSIHVYL